MAYLIQADQPIIFLANKRTASTSIRNYLLKHGAVQQGWHHDPPTYVPEGSIIFHVVRHHCDVLVSYWYKSQQGRPFEEFIELVLNDHHPYFKGTSLYGHWPIKPNWVINYKCFDVEFEYFRNKCNLPQDKLIRTPTKRPRYNSWSELFSSELYLKVREKYKKEMKQYGYY